MPVARAESVIDAPLDVVWSVMLDLPRYGEWNPFIVRAERSGGAEPAVGDDLRLHVKWRGRGGASSHERISRLEPPSAAGEVRRALLEYEYLGAVAALRLVRGFRQQELEQRADGPTVYRTAEDFSGLFSRVILGRVEDGFQRHADALKVRAEALAGAAR